MSYLPLSNILHYKLRSLLSALGIAIAICMLLTLSGLARGTLFEVADRWEAVDADLIMFPAGWGDNVSVKSGNGLWDSYAAFLAKKHKDIVQEIIPVYTWPMKLAGQDQMVAGVDPDQWHWLTGGRKLREGRLFDPSGTFAAWIEAELLSDAGDGETDEDSAADGLPESVDLALAPHDGLEIVIDSRLAGAGGYSVGQQVLAGNHKWTIVGIVPAGAMTRVFMPRRTAQYLFGGSIQQSTIMFVKLKSGVDVGPAAKAIGETTGQDVVPLASYRGMLRQKFDVMFRYVDAVNVVSLVIAFLFIMVTLYTMVLQRYHDVAILKSCGASNMFIVRQILAESLILSVAGAAAGLAMAFGSAWLIETFKPLYTVSITPEWIAIACGAAIVGSVISGLYPAWWATRIDVAEVLTLE